MTSLPIDPSTGPSPSGRQLALAWSATDGVPAMLKVAFATDDRVAVNQHFGAAAGFAIYALDAGRAKLVQVAEFPVEAMDGNENAVSVEGNACGAGVSRSQNKLAEKIAALSGCAAVYCLAAGGSAVRQLLAGGIQPVRMDDEACIDTLLTELRAAIRSGGVPWLDKALKRGGDAGRFDRMADEGWQE
ncbi:MAG: NifB/NifX family molybdenum-iron cluster-binding protein [Rhodocyclaceae bacterium]|nr:NifB/NifX family molybdenum-iron cluster-binding protein [Rhodocyclaceae bacterium]